jgi:uncharacterized protein
MRVVLDTNVLISALVQSEGLSAELIEAWRDSAFDLLCCDELLDEFRRVTRLGKFAGLFSNSFAGRFANDLRKAAIWIEPLPTVDRSSDPWDNFLLALSEAGNAHYLVTGDKAGLLALRKHRETRIVSVRQFADKLAA